MFKAMKRLVFITDLIKQDHDHVRALYKRLKTLKGKNEKTAHVNEFLRALSTHSVAEEVLVYPKLSSEMAQHNREEHLALKKALYELDQKVAKQDDCTSLVTRCYDLFEKHAKEEEEQMLPQIDEKWSESESIKLGEQFENLKNKIPTHPHPSAPDTWPFNSVAGMLTAPFDKVYDAVMREFPEDKGIEGDLKKTKSGTTY